MIWEQATVAMEPFVKTSKALTNALVKVAAAVEICVKEGILIFTLTLSEGTHEFYQRQPLIFRLSWKKKHFENLFLKNSMVEFRYETRLIYKK